MNRTMRGEANIPERVWVVGKARPLGRKTNGVYYDTPIKANAGEGLAPLTVLDRDGERALPAFTTHAKAERGILHFMTAQEREDGPIASVRVGLEHLITTFTGPRPEGTPKIDYIGVDMGEGGIYSLIRL
jgi:hypothetical protein